MILTHDGIYNHVLLSMGGAGWINLLILMTGTNFNIVIPNEGYSTNELSKFLYMIEGKRWLFIENIIENYHKYEVFTWLGMNKTDGKAFIREVREYVK